MAVPKFVPKDSQVDYTDIRYCPVVNITVVKDGKILLAKRHSRMRLYPGLWATVDGFLDDKKTIEEKVYEELKEELNINKSNIVGLRRGTPIILEAPEYSKTWLIIPMLAKVNTDKFKINGESEEARWFKPEEIGSLKLLPDNEKVIEQFMPL